MSRCAIHLAPFDPGDTELSATLMSLWNEAMPPDFEITVRGARFNTGAVTGGSQGACLATEDGEPVGFALASALPGAPSASPRDLGFVDAIAVHPRAQRQGVGTALLGWAETWIAGQGCARARLGGGARPFAPGVPSEAEPFFAARGYARRQPDGYVWDVARDLAGFAPAPANPTGPSVRPASPDESHALQTFLQNEFPGRWEFELEENLRNNCRIAEYLLLMSGGAIEGFAHVTLEDSCWPLDRVFPRRLPRPWGQLGPLGVSQRLRGRGYGTLLVDRSIAHLAAMGVRGCVIDWTHLLGFYAQFGFVPYHKYAILLRTL